MNKLTKPGFFDDSSGAHSSKRLVGIILAAVDLFLMLFLFFYSVLYMDTGFPTAIKIIDALSLLCGGLLGVGIFENLFRVEKGDKIK